MISYDLTEQLKDAGFFKDWELEVNEAPDKPTLSELIAACGDEFMSLILWPEPRGDLGRWTADTRGGRASGSTPEEAAAKAWLLLNKSQNEQTGNPYRRESLQIRKR